MTPRSQAWMRQAQNDLDAARFTSVQGFHAQACYLAGQAAEKALKALLADRDQDLRSHSLAALLRELGGEAPLRWDQQARLLDKLYAPTRYPDALGEMAPMDVFGPEDAGAAMQASSQILQWVEAELGLVS